MELGTACVKYYINIPTKKWVGRQAGSLMASITARKNHASPDGKSETEILLQQTIHMVMIGLC